jgi:ferric-dicitrate binding protein FerR (iron transport regulator)
MHFDKYADYTVSDFLQDEDFIRWVKENAPEEELFWDKFLLHYPDKQQAVEEARSILAAMTEAPAVPGLSRKEKETMLRNMQQELQRKRSQAALQARRRWLLTAAAAVVLLLAAGTWLYRQSTAPTPMITHATTYGEQESIELPDGSLVKLNAHSTLSYESNWEGRDSRKVWLNGEAFFEVAEKPQTKQKFQVVTEDLTVEVLGTVFNVNSHREETKVFLEKGKVKLSLNGLKEAMLMDPGELVTYSKNKKEKPAKQRVAPKLHTSWKDGLQSFDKTPLKEVLEKVEEIYGVSIQVNDANHYDRKITTALPVENLEEALSVLEMTLNLEISKNGDDYTIQ